MPDRRDSILQALSAIPPLWSQSASKQPCVSPLVKSVALNMSLLKRSTSPVDPYCSRRCLHQLMLLSISTPSKMHQKSYEIVSTTIETTVVCDVCLYSSTKEEKMDIVSVPLKKHIANSLRHLLQIQPLTGANMSFCPQCKSNQNTTTGSSITKSGSVLILQLRSLDNLFKDNRHVQCLPINNHHLKVPITTSDEVSISKNTGGKNVTNSDFRNAPGIKSSPVFHHLEYKTLKLIKTKNHAIDTQY